MAHSAWRKLGLFAILTIAVLTAAAFVTATYISRNFRVNTRHRPGGDVVSIETPGGALSIRGQENLDPAVLGMPVYPDAKRTGDRGGATFEWNSRDGKDDKALAVAGGEYITSDSPEQVVAWYKAQLPSWIVTTSKDNNDARFELRSGGYKHIVSIRPRGDGTHIAVATVGEPASN